MDTAPQPSKLSDSVRYNDTDAVSDSANSSAGNIPNQSTVQTDSSEIAPPYHPPQTASFLDNASAVYKPVKALDPETARKIAAGEVIDRPAAVIRELLDNAIDAGASKVQVEISGGGIDRIRVTDNGCGMSREDLAICTDTHTTSKISTAEDLLSLHSLGFRGEALSSIKAVSDLEITSTRNGPAAWKLQLGQILPARLHAGTVVQVENLFENFPARKQFLKRAAAETALCRTIFLDKALPHYRTEMRFIADGTLRFLLPPAQSLRERCLAAFSFKEPEALFFELEGSGEYFSFRIVLGSPDVVRSDKRAIMVFVNGRRITEFGLTQAIEYGSEGYFPNGGHPVAFLFLTVAPSRVDFNIHPAKKEARFQDYSALHHAVSSAVGSFYRQHTVASLLKEKYDPSLTRPLDFKHGGTAPEMGGGSVQSDSAPYSAWSERKCTQRQKALILLRTPAHWLPNMDMAKAPVLLQALKPAPMDIVGAALVPVRYIPALANKPMLMRQPILLPDTGRHIKPKPAHCLLSMDTATVQRHLKRNTIRHRTDTAAHSVN